MTSAVPAAPILAEIEAHQRRARQRFRAQSASVWVVLVGGLGIALWATGNINGDFIGKWGPFIIGGTWITILLSVTSILFATALAIVGAIGRLSENAFINGAASLYVSLVRGTPLLVQIYFVFFALPQFGIVLAIGNDFVAMIKDSALVSTIAVQELLWRAKTVGTQAFRTLETLLIAAVVYWLLTIVFSYFQEKLERRMAQGDR